jgi:hypothetical protein
VFTLLALSSVRWWSQCWWILWQSKFIKSPNTLFAYLYFLLYFNVIINSISLLDCNFRNQN